MVRGPLRITLRILGRTLLALLALLLLYALAVWLLPVLGVNTDHAGPPDGQLVYIRSNGVHTVIVLPVRTAVKDWSRELPMEHTLAADTLASHLAFGWGDKGFYLETKEWADLKASTAVKAVFGLSGTAMHISWCGKPVESASCRAVRVDASCLKRLVDRIERGFDRDANGRPILIAGRHYDRNDAFYEGTGRYSPFHTCNTWTNSVLKGAGLPAALWTATESGIMRQYEHP